MWVAMLASAEDKFKLPSSIFRCGTLLMTLDNGAWSAQAEDAGGDACISRGCGWMGARRDNKTRRSREKFLKKIRVAICNPNALYILVK